MAMGGGMTMRCEVAASLVRGIDGGKALEVLSAPCRPKCETPVLSTSQPPTKTL